MTPYLLLWPLAGLLTFAAVTLLDLVHHDLHLRRDWRLLAVWIPLSMLFGPLMLIGALISPPKMPWED